MDSLNLLCMNLRGSSTDKTNLLRRLLARTDHATVCHAILAQELSRSSFRSHFDIAAFHPHFPHVSFSAANNRGGTGVFLNSAVRHLLPPVNFQFSCDSGRVAGIALRLGAQLST
jgi:hypothetical protein